MPVTLNIVESTTELGQEIVEIVLASASTPGPAGPGVPVGGTDGQVLTKTSATDYATAWEDPTGGGGGAPTDADYLVGTANGTLSGEIVVGTSPGGELGGTWASPTVDATHSGSSHAGVQAAAEATAAAALSAHEADTTSIHGIANTANLYSVGGTDVAIADGGTGASTAAGARANLDLEAGTDFPSLATFNDHSARHEEGGADVLAITAGIVDSEAATDGQVLTADGAGAATWETPTGGGSGELLERDIAQTGHGLAVGDIVRHNGTAFVKAQGNSAANAEVVGIVSAVADVNNFTLHYGGRITGLSGLTAGAVYYLDDDTAGLLTSTEPTDTGDISKPLLVADSTTSGYFFNWRGAINADAVGGSTDGWTDDSVNTWTRTANQTFTVSGDRTAVFQKGTRLRWTQTTVKYGVVISSSHAAGTTTVTIATNTDYVLTAAAISVNSYSYELSPQGYPDFFNYSVTWTGSGGNPAIGNGTIVAKFRVIGKMCWARVTITMGTTTTFGSSFWNLTIPIAVAADWPGFLWGPVGGSSDVSGGNTAPTIWRASDGFLNYWNGSNVALVTNIAPFTWDDPDILTVATEYEF